MWALEPRGGLRMRRTGLVLLLVAMASLAGCGGEPEGPSPTLLDDITTLRQVVIANPAANPIASAERAADDRAVLASRLLQSGAIPAARRQIEAVQAAEVGSAEGRGWKERLETAYRLRVDGLEQWRTFLAAEGRDEEQLLEATSTLRRAEVSVVQIDLEMETVSPTRRRRGGETVAASAEDSP